MIKRSSGILLHLTSLPSKYGIGTLGKVAYEFANFLKKCGQAYWQMLPVGQTGFGDSPYQSFSTYAGNPYLIDLDMLANDGLLKPSEFNSLDFGEGFVDFSKQFELKHKIFRLAFARKNRIDNCAYNSFKQQHGYWLDDYALFMALKSHFDLLPWNEWPDKDIMLRTDEAMLKYSALLKDEIEYWKFLQYLFFSQWNMFKKYVELAGIKIIGDIPIYVAMDSADAWSSSENFWLDDEKKPVRVAGCPPDYFSQTGQLWGNPLYDWDYMQKTGFEWWIKRIKHSSSLFDVIRIDHFRGFDSYYAIPYGNTTAVEGEWKQGIGSIFFDAISEQIPGVEIIAEDLGDLFPSVHELRNKTGLPGMKILQFAFDSGESNTYLPHSYEQNCVVYTGTHDNDTLGGWLQTISEKDLLWTKNYLGLNDEEGYNWGIIRGAWSSVARLAVAQMQDFLNLDSSYRMNKPSTIGDNWSFRLSEGMLNDELAKRIYNMTQIYSRLC